MTHPIGSARDASLQPTTSSPAEAGNSERLASPVARLSVSQITTFRSSFDEDVQQYADSGIGSMGLWLRKLYEYGEERGIELVLDSGMAVSSVSHAGGFTGVNRYSYDEAVADGRRAIEICQAVRAGTLVVMGGGRHGHTRRHAHRLVRDGLRTLGRYAADCGVKLAVQPVSRRCGSDWSFLSTLGQTIEMLDDVALPNVQIAADLFHLRHESNLVEKLTAVAPRIAVVQLSDCAGESCSEYDRMMPGDGELEVMSAVDALLASGYEGMFDVQVWSTALWSSDYRYVLAECRSRFEHLCSLPSST